MKLFNVGILSLFAGFILVIMSGSWLALAGLLFGILAGGLVVRDDMILSRQEAELLKRLK